MKTSATILRTLAATQPTQTIREVLNNTLLFGRSSAEVIEVWSCIPLERPEFVLKPQPADCTAEIPIQFEINNKTSEGYLDPVTMRITHHGTPTDCSLVSTHPLKIKNRIYNYQRKTGTLTKAGRLRGLDLLQHQWSTNHSLLMKPMIFKPIVMYSWKEMQPDNHLNAILKSAAVNAEVMEMLGKDYNYNQDHKYAGAADGVAQGILKRGLPAAGVLLRNPVFSIVFGICIIAVLGVIYKLWRSCREGRVATVMNQISLTRRRRDPDNPDAARTEETNSLTEPEEGPAEPIDEVINRSLPSPVCHVCRVSAIEQSLIILGTVNGRVGRFLFDSGSALTLISEGMVRALGIAFKPLSCAPAVSVTGERIGLLGEVDLQLRIGELELEQLFRIFPGCCYDGILGLDCMKKWGPIMLDPAARKLRIGQTELPLEQSRAPPLKMMAVSTTKIPARCVAVISASTSIPVKPGQAMVFEQDSDRYEQFMSPRTLLQSAANMPVRIVNPSPYSITIYKSQRIGSVVAAKMIQQVQYQEKTNGGAAINRLDGLDLANNTLTLEEKKELTVLLEKYGHLFARNESELPGTTAVEHHIKLTDERPIRQKAYRVPNSLRKQLDEKLDGLLDAGIIAPSNSPFAAPLVIVKKANSNEIRPCVDFRRLNAVTVPDSYPLPRVDESMEFLSGAKYLTTLDLMAGFNQIGVAKDSQKYTAFITSRGLFEYKRLPFGLCNAPAEFSRLMQYVLSGLLFHSSMLYMDDVLIASKTWKEHLSHLEEVLKRLDHFNLRLKMKKCTFGRRQLPFLGYLITTDGILPDPANIARLSQFKRPATVTQTRSFLGFVNYYRRFIQDFAAIAKPLYSLTKKENKFLWTPACQKAFETLREKVTTSPLLVYPNFNLPFVLACDASKHGCGAVLSQVEDGQDKPIAYWSKKFNGAESRYETVEQELYSVIQSLRHWKHYVYGHQVYVYSDQKSLSWGIKQCDSPRMMRWIQQLSEYTVKIFYREGSKQVCADHLSRYPEDDVDLMYDTEGTSIVGAVFEIGTDGPDYFKEEQMKDKELERIIQYKKGELTVADATTKRLAGKYVILRNGILGITLGGEGGTACYIVPQHLKSRILEELHDCVWGAHLGVARTYGKITQRFYWEGLRQSVIDWIASCESCAVHKKPTQPINMEMQVGAATSPWQICVIDMVGPLPLSAKGNQWIMCVMDQFTKWPECVALRSATAKVVARAFLSTVVCRHGVPRILKSDRGSQFISEVFAELSRLLGMKRQLSCAYRPQSQGLVERWNRTMAGMLRQYCSSNQKAWCQYLDVVMMAYRTSTHTSTGATPFELQHGRQACLPTHILAPEAEREFHTESEFVADIQDRMKAAYDATREANHEATSQQKHYHDRQINPSKLQPGDRVYVLRPSPQVGLTPKLQPKYKGPYEISTILGTNALLGPPPPARGKIFWVHLNHLKRMIPRTVPEFQYKPAHSSVTVEPLPRAEMERLMEAETAAMTQQRHRYNLRRRVNASTHCN